MWVVHWRVEGRSGHGSPVHRWVASLAIAAMTERYGTGTHRMEQAP